MCNWNQCGEVGHGLMRLITDGQIMSSRIKLPVNEAEADAHNVQMVCKIFCFARNNDTRVFFFFF